MERPDVHELHKYLSRLPSSDANESAQKHLKGKTAPNLTNIAACALIELISQLKESQKMNPDWVFRFDLPSIVGTEWVKQSMRLPGLNTAESTSESTGDVSSSRDVSKNVIFIRQETLRILTHVLVMYEQSVRGVRDRPPGFNKALLDYLVAELKDMTKEDLSLIRRPCSTNELRPPATYVYGMPGIGKSYFLNLMFFIGAALNAPIIFHRNSHQGASEVSVFAPPFDQSTRKYTTTDPTSKYHCGLYHKDASPCRVNHWLARKERCTLYLFDPDQHDLRSPFDMNYNSFMLYVSSDRSGRLLGGTFEKDPYHYVIVMYPWSRKELAAIGLFDLECYLTFGGSIRKTTEHFDGRDRQADLISAWNTIWNEVQKAPRHNRSIAGIKASETATTVDARVETNSTRSMIIHLHSLFQGTTFAPKFTYTSEIARFLVMYSHLIIRQEDAFNAFRDLCKTRLFSSAGLLFEDVFFEVLDSSITLYLQCKNSAKVNDDAEESKRLVEEIKRPSLVLTLRTKSNQTSVGESLRIPFNSVNHAAIHVEHSKFYNHVLEIINAVEKTEFPMIIAAPRDFPQFDGLLVKNKETVYGIVTNKAKLAAPEGPSKCNDGLTEMATSLMMNVGGIVMVTNNPWFKLDDEVVDGIHNKVYCVSIDMMKSLVPLEVLHNSLPRIW